MFTLTIPIRSKEDAKELVGILMEAHVVKVAHILEIETQYEWEGEPRDVIEYQVDLLCDSLEDVIVCIYEKYPKKLPGIEDSQIEVGEDIRRWYNNMRHRHARAEGIIVTPMTLNEQNIFKEEE